MNRKGRTEMMMDIQGRFVFPRSLNQEKRRKELLRVSKENATLAKRIIELKPEGNRDSWRTNWSRNSSYLDNIAKYEAEWYLPKVISSIFHR